MCLESICKMTVFLWLKQQQGTLDLCSILGFATNFLCRAGCLSSCSSAPQLHIQRIMFPFTLITFVIKSNYQTIFSHHDY